MKGFESTPSHEDPERERFLDAMQEMAEAFQRGDGENGRAALARAHEYAENIADQKIKQECLALVAEVEKVGE